VTFFGEFGEYNALQIETNYLYANIPFLPILLTNVEKRDFV
jgi:hypothetical protein